MYLRHAIQSVLAQTWEDFELIVVDNCSEDRTSEMLSNLDDARVAVFHQDQPVSRMRNWATGLSLANGDYVAFLSDDDLWHEDFLSVAAHFLQAKKSIDLIFFDHWIVDREGRLLVSETQATSARFGRDELPYGVVDDFLSVTIEKQPVSMNSAVYRRAAIESLSAWSDAKMWPWSDYPINAQLALQEGVAFYVPLRLGYYRRHNEAVTAAAGTVSAELEFLASEAHICQQLLANPLPSRIRSFLEEKRWNSLRRLTYRYLLCGEIGKAGELLQSLRDEEVSGPRLVGWTAAILKRLEGRPLLFRLVHGMVIAAALVRNRLRGWQMRAPAL